MAYIKFADSNTLVQGTVIPESNGNIVTLKFKDNVVVDTSGFEVYLDADKVHKIGVYTDFATLYRNDEETAKYNGYQLSNDGSVYAPTTPNVSFYTNGGGVLAGQTTQEVNDYSELVIPKPIANNDYEFTQWSPEIPKSGKVESNKSFTAIFTSTLPVPEPEPSLEERVALVEEQNMLLSETVDSILVDVIPSLFG